MLGEEDGEQKGPAFNGCWRAVRTKTIVAEKVDKRRCGDGAKPGEKA